MATTVPMSSISTPPVVDVAHEHHWHDTPLDPGATPPAYDRVCCWCGASLRMVLVSDLLGSAPDGHGPYFPAVLRPRVWQADLSGLDPGGLAALAGPSPVTKGTKGGGGATPVTPVDVDPEPVETTAPIPVRYPLVVYGEPPPALA